MNGVFQIPPIGKLPLNPAPECQRALQETEKQYLPIALPWGQHFVVTFPSNRQCNKLLVVTVLHVYFTVRNRRFESLSNMIFIYHHFCRLTRSAFEGFVIFVQIYIRISINLYTIIKLYCFVRASPQLKSKTLLWFSLRKPVIRQYSRLLKIIPDVTKRKREILEIGQK